MAFKKKTWKDRLVEYAGRRTLKRVSGDPNGTVVVDVSRNEGNVSQAGDAFSASNMNDLEQRIADEFTAVTNNLTKVRIYVGSDDKLHFTNSAGADSVLNFNNKSTTITNIPWLCAGLSPYYSNNDKPSVIFIPTNGLKVRIKNAKDAGAICKVWGCNCSDTDIENGILPTNKYLYEENLNAGNGFDKTYDCGSYTHLCVANYHSWGSHVMFKWVN